MASFCICVDAVSEDVYKLVAERVQEPQAGEQQENAVEHAPEEIANPADLQGKPRSMTHKFSVCVYIYINVYISICAFKF